MVYVPKYKPGPVVHGGEVAYRRGCRCEVCVPAQKERRRWQRGSQAGGTVNYDVSDAIDEIARVMHV